MDDVFVQFPAIETPRLVLRELREGDADAVFTLFRDPAVTRYHDLDTFTEIAQAREVIARVRRRFAERTGIRWAITRRDEDVVIGTGGFNRWNMGDRYASLGYELARSAWGQGIMTEAAGAMVGFAFARLGMNRIEAETMLDNTASMRVLAKLGFQEEGILRQRYYWKGAHHDLRMFALLRREYGERAGSRE